uniref:Uncharacterized protein n=1 Tax=Meloidogyne hapla TaxID=6305 RepID=A0A1I8BZF7_MELHA
MTVIIFMSDGTTSGAYGLYEQGCGECPIPSIPCRSCSSWYCNSKDFFTDANFCWDKENDVAKACKITETRTSEIEQGCEEDINWNEKNMQIVKCVMPLCNTKELYDNTLFCLNKGKNGLETKKARDKCDDGMCFVHHHWDNGKCKKK